MAISTSESWDVQPRAIEARRHAGITERLKVATGRKNVVAVGLAKVGGQPEFGLEAEVSPVAVGLARVPAGGLLRSHQSLPFLSAGPGRGRPPKGR